MEQWLPVVGYEGLYEVSSEGRVRSLDRTIWRQSRTGTRFPWVRPGVVLKPHRIPDSHIAWRRYWQIGLTGEDGVQRKYKVHTLVANAFLGPRPHGQEIRHGAEGQLVNTVGNLSYGTPKENRADQVRDGTSNRGEGNPQARLTEADVREIRARWKAGERQKDLAAEFEVSRGTLSMVVAGQRWGHLSPPGN